MVEDLPDMCEGLGMIPGTSKMGGGEKKKSYREYKF